MLALATKVGFILDISKANSYTLEAELPKYGCKKTLNGNQKEAKSHCCIASEDAFRQHGSNIYNTAIHTWEKVTILTIFQEKLRYMDEFLKEFLIKKNAIPIIFKWTKTKTKINLP